MNRVTPFGKAVRKYRIDRGETQMQVAEALGVTVAFLSAVETGKKNVPTDLLRRLIAHFALPDDEAESLQELAFRSQREVKIELQGRSDRSRALAAGFARKFNNNEIEEESMNRIFEILGN